MSNNVFRRRVGDVFVIAEFSDGEWHVEVTDAASRPVSDELRKAALVAVMEELSSLRRHIWQVELGN